MGLETLDFNTENVRPLILSDSLYLPVLNTTMKNSHDTQRKDEVLQKSSITLQDAEKTLDHLPLFMHFPSHLRIFIHSSYSPYK